MESSGRSRLSDKAGGGGGHPDPEITGGAGLQKIFFRPFGPHFGLKIRRGGGPPGPLPRIRYWKVPFQGTDNFVFQFCKK